MVWSLGTVSVEFRDVPQWFFNITLYTLINYWLGKQKSNTNLNYIFFFMNIKFD